MNQDSIILKERAIEMTASCTPSEPFRRTATYVTKRAFVDDSTRNVERANIVEERAIEADSNMLLKRAMNLDSTTEPERAMALICTGTYYELDSQCWRRILTRLVEL